MYYIMDVWGCNSKEPSSVCRMLTLLMLKRSRKQPSPSMTFPLPWPRMRRFTQSLRCPRTALSSSRRWPLFKFIIFFCNHKWQWRVFDVPIFKHPVNSRKPMDIPTECGDGLSVVAWMCNCNVWNGDVLIGGRPQLGKPRHVSVYRGELPCCLWWMSVTRCCWPHSIRSLLLILASPCVATVDPIARTQLVNDLSLFICCSQMVTSSFRWCFIFQIAPLAVGEPCE